MLETTLQTLAAALNGGNLPSRFFKRILPFGTGGK